MREGGGCASHFLPIPLRDTEIYLILVFLNQTLQSKVHKAGSSWQLALMESFSHASGVCPGVGGVGSGGPNDLLYIFSQALKGPVSPD
jgi:hypothetical protein